MPWSNQGGGGNGGPWGGGGRGGGPWGGGGGGPQQPDLEEILRKGQDRVRRAFPGGFGSGKGVLILGALAIVLWLVSGLYRVGPDEQGVAMIFGKLDHVTQPGLHWNFPAPIGSVETPKVTVVNRVEVGFRSGAEFGRADRVRNIPDESLMLTGDENIIDIQSVVFWVINDAGKYLFNIRNPDETVKNIAESVMREQIGKRGFEFARTTGRGEIQGDAKEQIQNVLDDYGAGILVTQVEMQKVDPPERVIDAFRDVQAARADKERAINESQAYASEVTEKALGEAQQLVRDAEAYKEEKINRAGGAAERFLAILREYEKAPEITRRRIYLETMQGVMGDMDKILLDEAGSGGGAVPYVSLNELMRKSKAPRAETGGNR